MSTGDHPTMRDALDCTEQQGKAWLPRTHTADEIRAAHEFMTRGFNDSVVESWPPGMTEALVEWKLIADDLDHSHRHIWAGGGIEASDHVRSLLLIELRCRRIAEAHHKHVDERGGTWGACNECGLAWPCPTYVWATSDDRNPATATWDPADDGDDQ